MHEKLKPKSCEHCGQTIPFPSHPTSVTQWERRRVCSRSCWGKICAKERAASERTCEACGVRYRPKHPGQKFCSSECAKGRYKNRQGSKHWAWKGGRHIDPAGYVHVLIRDDHPFIGMARNGRYVLEHRLVMAEHLARPLRRNETVHHVNGDRSDNRLENLQIRTGRHGKGRKCVCAECGSENIVEVPL